MSKTTVSAPANIAFIKYWGARDLDERHSDEHLDLDDPGALRHPVHRRDAGQAARTRSGAPSRTAVLAPPTPSSPAGCATHLDRIRKWAGRKEPLRVATRNTFPTAGGLASSASGFAALTLAAAGAFGKKASHEGALAARPPQRLRLGLPLGPRRLRRVAGPQAEGNDERQLRPPDRRRRPLGPAQRHRRGRDRPQDHPLARRPPPRHHQPVLHQAPGAAARAGSTRSAQGDQASATSTPSARCSRRRRSTST